MIEIENVTKLYDERSGRLVTFAQARRLTGSPATAFRI